MKVQVLSRAHQNKTLTSWSAFYFDCASTEVHDLRHVRKDLNTGVETASSNARKFRDQDFLFLFLSRSMDLNMHIPVIFEDSDIIVTDKPPGIVVHPFDFSSEETVLDFLQEHSPSMFSIDNSITLQDGRVIPLGGIVHKLDRETSGVLVVAKNQGSFDNLKEQFRSQKIEKKYVALAEGIIEKDSFRIDAPLGRGKKEYKQSTNPINPRGPLREAITDVEVLRRNESNTLIELSPRTGRTHQLRAHMSSIGHPIVGDIAYGSPSKECRIMLHARSLAFQLNGKRKLFESPLPEEFQ
jgi:23S rRNA pseudouridine1911/1915/1917 synthase